MESMSEKFQEFESVKVPLEGMNLVEAAAGTGKTYNIQNIVVRLLWENNLNISQIAVLSFTKEAASELAERIRRVFDRVLAVMEGRKIEDENEFKQAVALVEHDRTIRPDIEDKARIAVIKEALRDFDSANISTINGFCQKLLLRFAFESGSSFSARLETKPNPIIRAILDDWMRSKFYDEELGDLYKALIDERQIYKLERLVLDFNLENPEYDSTLFFDGVDKLLKALPSNGVPAVLDESVFKSNVISRLKRLEKAIKSKDFAEFFALIGEAYNREYIENKGIRAANKAEGMHRLNTDPFLQACCQINDQMNTVIAALKREALVYASKRFAELEQSGNFMTFADQIHIVDEAVKRSESFVNSLRSKLKAGIIDEFQDTDPAQYRIFKALFNVEGGCAFMVGDPRQAIYRFRGGDINAYLTAKQELLKDGTIYRLGVNYRSSVKMVEAVNRIFATHPDPFCHPQITFPELASRGVGKAPELLIDGKPAEEAMFRYQIPNKNESWAEACARRISYILSGEAKIAKPPKKDSQEPRPVVPGDITVLLRSNKSCVRMRQELEKYNIPAVCLKSGNVYAGSEAADLYIILDAIVNSGDRKKVHTALASGLCKAKVPLSVLESSTEDAETLNEFRKIFFKLHSLWQKKGFSAMFETLLKKFKIRENLAVQAEGERRLTNLFQLEELLLQQSVTENLSPERLISQFGSLIAVSKDSKKETKDEEHEELMSSDGSSVRIMTMHASKGLQAPIVIIPGVMQFKLDENKRNGFCSEDGVRVLNLNEDKQKNMLETAELEAEMRRLIYVAITRAEYRCEVFEEEKSSGTQWHALLGDPSEVICSELSAKPFTRQPLVLKSSVPQVENVDPAWQVISYSALTSNVNSDLEQTVQDHDEDGDGGNNEKDQINFRVFSPYTISGGTGFGNIMHSYLETADFKSSLSDCRKSAAVLMEQIKIPDIENVDEFTSAYGKWIHGIFNAPIADWQGGSFSLADIPVSDRLMELEFCCSLDEFNTGRLSEVIKEYTSAEFGKIKYPDNWEKTISGGILTGFIDMVFRRDGKYYIVDWKTNRLGYKAEDYRSEKLGHAMVHSMYFVQYLLYMVALVRHLRRYCNGVFGEAEYEKMIGGVYYFFVRGMAPSAPGRGIFRSRPSWKTVCELEEMLCQKM